MTVLVYHEGILGADKRALMEECISHSERISTVTKIHLSSCKRFAIGMVGGGRLPKDIPKVMSLLGAVIFKYKLANCTQSVLTDEEREFLDLENTLYLAVTSDCLFLFNDKGARQITGSIFMGSGANVARGAIECGKSVRDAIVIAGKYITTVGNGIDIIDCSDLLPIEITEANNDV